MCGAYTHMHLGVGLRLHSYPNSAVPHWNTTTKVDTTTYMWYSMYIEGR